MNAPTAANAYWPSDNCPAQPVRTTAERTISITTITPAKAMRRLRNNGTPEEFIMVDMLSPYEGDGSVLGDIRKLLNSGFDGEKVIMIYGYDYPDWPLQIAIDCFETLAEKFFCKFNAKFQASFSGLVHPYHKEGKIFCWVVDNK